MVSLAKMAVGQSITLACGTNPTKLVGFDKMILGLQQTPDGWRKDDPPMKKQLPVEADVLTYVGDLGRMAGATELIGQLGIWH